MLNIADKALLIDLIIDASRRVDNEVILKSYLELAEKVRELKVE